MQNIFGPPQYLAEITAADTQALFSEALAKSPSALLVLCCDTDPEELTFFNDILTRLAIPVCGGVFPGIVFQTQDYATGLVIVPILVPIQITVFTELSSAQNREFTFEQEVLASDSLLVLVDGLARNIDRGLNQIYSTFGDEVIVCGGGAGSLSFEQRPCLFTNQGLVADALLVAAFKQNFTLAVGHGWKVLEGPFLANQVDDNRIIQLNFQPAFDVYKQVVETHSKQQFTDDNFFDLAKSFPFGIDRLDDELLVRDPVTHDSESLVCVGKVPESTMLYILNADGDVLVEAAANAVQRVAEETEYNAGLLFDCISRKLFLNDEFDRELVQIKSKLSASTHLFGALVLGEIASGKYGAINFHNKTAVLALT